MENAKPTHALVCSDEACRHGRISVGSLVPRLHGREAREGS